MNRVWSHPTTGASLWQGDSKDSVNVDEIRRRGVGMVVFAAIEHQPDLPDDIEVVRLRVADFVPSSVEMFRNMHGWASTVADLVAKSLANGRSVLSTCWKGWNRSGLVSALTLTRVGGVPPSSAVSAVRRARGSLALSNPSFVRMIYGDFRLRRNHAHRAASPALSGTGRYSRRTR